MRVRGCSNCKCQCPQDAADQVGCGRTAGVSDPEYVALLYEMAADSKEWPAVLSHYARFRNGLSNVDGVALYKGRVVVPVLVPRSGGQAWLVIWTGFVVSVSSVGRMLRRSRQRHLSQLLLQTILSSR